MMIKICGITTREDAVAAVEAGATALGFNFWPRSPRFVTPEQAAGMGEGLKVLRVGVFVDETPEAVAAAARTAHLDVVQLHGSENPSDYAPLRIWKAYRVTENWSGSEADGAACEAVLLDGPAPGTGVGFDWALTKGLRQRVVLAGGLGPDNVAEAIRTARPWGVDACSRLEKAPGIKDHERMRRFIESAAAVKS